MSLPRAFPLFATFVLCFSSSARAEPLLSDTFNYPDGPLVSESAGKWNTHSGTSNQITVVGGRIQLTASDSEDVNAELAGQPYDTTQSTNRFYASFTLRLTSLPSSAGTYFAHFKSSSATTFAGRIWVFTNGAAAGTFRVGISSTSGSTVSAIFPTDLNPNTDYQIVTRLVSSNSVAKLWIDPSAESDASVSTSESPSSFTVVSYAFRQSTGEGVLNIDNLRVGTAFSDVVTNAPTEQAPIVSASPQNTAVLEGGTAVFTVNASANPPPDYQWQFQGTNLPGATNASLTLTNVNFAQSGYYSVLISNAIDLAVTEPVTLNVFSTAAPAFSLLDYNMHGNGVLNWSTNTAHVRAIGRQVQYLDPDIITFQEIPVTNNGTALMADFVAAFRPGFYLATNSTDDLYIRSVIISRYPIIASRSRLHAANLQPFGYTGTGFTRDLFEAEIAVPNFPQPLHVFTVHLKSGQDNDAAAKRAAEAGAISNFFVNGFLTTNALHPYLITGDMNEDIMHPPDSDPQSIQRLVNGPAGFKLTTPFNPISAGELTFNIQNATGLTRRYDYILPCGLLFSNAVSSQVFRTDLLNPLPPNLFSSDDQTASDHLPVLMGFGNPYNKPFNVSISPSVDGIKLKWPGVAGQSYRVEKSADLTNWTALLDNLLATNSSDFVIGDNVSQTNQFFRVRRL